MTDTDEIKKRKCGKVSYETKLIAITDARHIHNQTKRYSRHALPSKKNNLKLRPYECFICGMWHLTSQRKRKY